MEEIYLGQKKSTLKDQVYRCTWLLRPSLNIMCFSFSGGNLGNIENANTTIYLLNHKAEPTYKYTTGPTGKYYSYSTYIVQSSSLAINYKQNQIGIQPKIALCTNPYKTKISVQLFAAYFIPLFESGGLQLIQHSGDEPTHLVSGSASTKLKNQKGVTATYNNHSFHSTPFHANNIFVGIVFGMNF